MTIYEPFCITPQQLTTALHRQNTRLSFQGPKLGLREHIFHKSELIFFIFKSNSHLLSSWLLPPPHRRCNFQQEVFLLLEFLLRPRPPFWCSGTHRTVKGGAVLRAVTRSKKQENEKPEMCLMFFSMRWHYTTTFRCVVVILVFFQRGLSLWFLDNLYFLLFSFSCFCSK